MKLLLAILAAALLTSCLDITGELQDRFEKCKSFQPGVTLDQLRAAFGPEKERNPMDPEALYIFDQGNYQLIYSGPIIAETDSSGDVISLSCAESTYAFRGL